MPTSILGMGKGSMQAASEPPNSTSDLAEIQRIMNLREGHPDSGLTGREAQVLRHVALGLGNREIGLSLEISIETVKEHVQNILRKTGNVDRTQSAVWAVKQERV